MRRATDLEARLVEWGREYAGGRYENVGWQGVSPLYSAMKYHGRAPQGLNPARIVIDGEPDEVERAVRRLEVQPTGFTAAQVMRCEYMMIDHPREVRMQRLSRIGMKMDTSRYGQHLRMARVHVAACLGLLFEEPLNDQDREAMLEYVAGV